MIYTKISAISDKGMELWPLRSLHGFTGHGHVLVSGLNAGSLLHLLVDFAGFIRIYAVFRSQVF